jgi:hypothetical protein
MITSLRFLERLETRRACQRACAPEPKTSRLSAVEALLASERAEADAALAARISESIQDPIIE